MVIIHFLLSMICIHSGKFNSLLHVNIEQLYFIQVNSMAPVPNIEDIGDIPQGEPVLLEGGLVVTVIKKPKECIRKVNTHETLLNNIRN